MNDNHPVLLALDFQQGVADRIATPEVLEAAGRAVDAARTAGIPVIWVRVAFRPGYPEVASSPTFAAAPATYGDVMTLGHPATEVHAAFDPHADEPIVTKLRVSAFTGSDLEVLLRAHRADTLVLAGVATGGVVLSTVRQAADLDYRLVVLSDACADTDSEVHRVLTEKVFPRQALVTTVDEWVATL